MTEDVKDVQPAEVSKEGTPAPEVKLAPESGTVPPVQETKEEPQQQSLTPDTVKELIAKELTAAKEEARREIQSAKDKARAEVENALRKATAAESTLNTVRGRLKESDPDFEKDLKIAEMEATLKQYSLGEREARMREQAKQFEDAFKANLSQFIVDNEVDIKDSRIDWGEDAKDYLERQQRVLKSVTKIRKEESKKAEEKRSQEVKDIETRIRKSLGLDTVDTSQPSTPISASSSKDQIIGQYARGEISLREYEEGLKKLKP